MSHSPFLIKFQSDVALQDSFQDFEQDDHVLAVLGFSSKTESFSNTKPVFTTALNNLEGASISSSSVIEVWKSPEPVKTKSVGDLLLSWNSQLLFGFIQLNEADFDNLVEASESAYQQILSALNQHPTHSKLLRMWNYFSSINDDSSGLERYREFCLGRQNALDQFDNFPYSPPAATAIGTSNGDLQIYFIASHDAGMQLENPRQTSAFLYPKKYGEVSPSFSRATYKRWDEQSDHLYISGTTSIVGSKSQHVDDATQQLKETLNNVEALVQHGFDTLDLSIQTLEELSHLKVYLRDASLLPLAKALLEKRFSNAKQSPTILYLQGDVCRADLLVEIEAGFV